MIMNGAGLRIVIAHLCIGGRETTLSGAEIEVHDDFGT